MDTLKWAANHAEVLMPTSVLGRLADGDEEDFRAAAAAEGLECYNLENMVVIAPAADSADELEGIRDRVQQQLHRPLDIDVSLRHDLIGRDQTAEILKQLLERETVLGTGPGQATPTPDPSTARTPGDEDLQSTTPDKDTRNTGAGGETPKPGDLSRRQEEPAPSSGEMSRAPTPENASQAPASGALFHLDDELWTRMPQDKQEELAKAYFESLVNNRILIDRGQAYNMAPEVVLLDGLPDDEGLDIRAGMLRARAKTYEKADRDVLRARAATETALLNEAVEAMKKWRRLADLAPWFLGVMLLVACVLGAVAFQAVFQDHINGFELATILFVLALFAISPAVLLLIERPLAGLDSWTPAGAAKDEEDESRKGGDSEETEKETVAAAEDAEKSSREK